MGTFPDDMEYFRGQLLGGRMQGAYRGLMEYMLGLRTRFEERHPEWEVSGNLYYGFMDMTYFALFPKEMKARKLKIALVFLYDEFRFDAWLSGSNRQVQENYWKKIKGSGWDKHRIVPVIKGSDSIVECTIEKEPDFRDLEGLTRRIEGGAAKFIQDIAGLLGTLKA